MSDALTMRSRRLPFWVVIVALVACALGGVFVLLWFKLPTWAPAWVVEHSPWVDPIVRAVEADKEVRSEAWDRLAGFGPAIVPAMAQYLETKIPSQRWLAAEFLGNSEEPTAFNTLLPFLSDRDPHIVYEVMTMLRLEPHRPALQRRRDAIVPDLIAHLGDEGPQIQGKAAELLGILREEDAVEPLLQLLQEAALNDELVERKANVIFALGEIGNAKAIAPLIAQITGKMARVLEGYDPGLVRGTITPTITALGKLPSAEVADAILPIPDDFSESGWRIDVASQLMDPRAVLALEEALRLPESDHKTDWDRIYVGGRAAYAASALARAKHPEGRRLFEAALRDPVPLIRRRAVLGVAHTFGHDVEPRLIQAVQDAVSDPEDQVRFAAAFAYRFWPSI